MRSIQHFEKLKQKKEGGKTEKDRGQKKKERKNSKTFLFAKIVVFVQSKLNNYSPLMNNNYVKKKKMQSIIHILYMKHEERKKEYRKKKERKSQERRLGEGGDGRGGTRRGGGG